MLGIESSNHRRWREDMQVTTSRHTRDHALVGPKILAKNLFRKQLYRPSQSVRNNSHAFRFWIAILELIIANRIRPKWTSADRVDTFHCTSVPIAWYISTQQYCKHASHWVVASRVLHVCDILHMYMTYYTGI